MKLPGRQGLLRVGTFAGLSVVAQGIGALSGLLLARWMSVGDYALYSVFLTAVGAVAILTAGGVNFAFNGFLGRVWGDSARINDGLLAATRERGKLALGVMPVMMLTTGWLLYRNGGGGLVIAALLGALCATWYADHRTRLQCQLLVFAGRTTAVQGLTTISSVARLALTVLAHLGLLLGAIAAAWITAIAETLKLLTIPRRAAQHLPPEAGVVRDEDAAEFRSFSQRQLPVAIFYCLQPQFVLALLAYFATPADTAAMGAVTRVGQLLLPAQAIVDAFAVPRFSKATSALPLRFAGWSLLTLVPGLALVAIAAARPEWLLWLLGEHYRHLRQEILIASIAAATTMWLVSTGHLLANRGLNRHAWLNIPVAAAWMAAGPWLFDMSSLSGVLWFQVGLNASVAIATLAELRRALRAWRAPH